MTKIELDRMEVGEIERMFKGYVSLLENELKMLRKNNLSCRRFSEAWYEEEIETMKKLNQKIRLAHAGSWRDEI